MKTLSRWLLLRNFIVLAAICLLWAPSAEAADAWAGRWQGSLVITGGPGAGTTLPCEFILSPGGSGLAGTVSCPGFGPVPFSGNGTGDVAGTVSGGITFRGARRGNSATGTWTFAAKGNSGKWSITRAAVR